MVVQNRIYVCVLIADNVGAMISSGLRAINFQT